MALLAISFNSRILIADKGIDITTDSQAENIVSNKTIAVTMHEPESLQMIYVSKDNAPLERNLLKTYDSHESGVNTMPLAPMAMGGSSSSSEDNKSSLFSFDTPQENDNQNWGWMASEVNNAGNYRDITPTRKTSGGLFRDTDSRTSSGYERESFFDDTLYGSDKGNSFLDGYGTGGSSSKDTDASPYSTMSW